MNCHCATAATFLALFATGDAAASSSTWLDTDGARIRLVTTGLPDAQGRLKGMLDIVLQPGWKTYWRDPGDAGVPPTLDVHSNPDIVAADLDFPAPQRHDEGDFKWAGYDYPVALPITFTFKPGSAGSPVEASVFLGVCETICVPVQAKLAVDPAAAPDDPMDEAAVTAAFAAVPHAAGPGFGVKVAESSGTAATFEASFAGSPSSAELFIAGEDGYLFTTPVRDERGGRTYFTVEVTRPQEAPSGPGLRYTLVTDAGAVSGVVPYF
ncbi:MAG: protein-disulfide reductase DsbD family protein [Hyphomicrobiales bacterium]|nr:protein-disulfide reductase DsbD family protein [Hyphomicrobiales bacterium]